MLVPSLRLQAPLNSSTSFLSTATENNIQRILGSWQRYHTTFLLYHVYVKLNDIHFLMAFVKSE